MCAGMSRHIGQHAMLCMDEHLCISQHLLLEALSELHAFLTELSCGKPFLSTDDKILPATQAGNPPFFLVSFQNVSQDTNHCYSKSKACSTKTMGRRCWLRALQENPLHLLKSWKETEAKCRWEPRGLGNAGVGQEKTFPLAL